MCLKAIYINFGSDLYNLWGFFPLSTLMCYYLCAAQRKGTASSQIRISIWCVHMGGRFIKPSEIYKLFSSFPLFSLITRSCNRTGARQFHVWGLEGDMLALALALGRRPTLPLVGEGVRVQPEERNHPVESSGLWGWHSPGKNLCSDMYKNVTDCSNPTASSLIKRANGLSSRSAAENKQRG